MKERIFYWTPRVITVLALIFMLMFSFDVFSEKESFDRKMLAFLMHNIPMLILAGIFAAAWFWELEGGIFLLVAVGIACIKFHSFTTNKGSLYIFIPFIIAAILFIVHHLIYRKAKEPR